MNELDMALSKITSAASFPQVAYFYLTFILSPLFFEFTRLLVESYVIA